MKILTAYLSSALTFVILDAIWLSVMGPMLYRPALGPILTEQVRWIPAVAFYLLFIGGIVYFGVWPALAEQRWTVALLNGAVFGFLAYATYDLTKHATLKIWATPITLADMAWGAAVSAAASVAGYLATVWLVPKA